MPELTDIFVNTQSAEAFMTCMIDSMAKTYLETETAAKTTDLPQGEQGSESGDVQLESMKKYLRKVFDIFFQNDYWEGRPPKEFIKMCNRIIDNTSTNYH